MDKIEDLYGNEWKVDKHSPSYKVISALHTMGFKYIVLSTSVLVGLIDKPDGMVYDVENLERQVRYNDIVIALGGNDG